MSEDNNELNAPQEQQQQEQQPVAYTDDNIRHLSDMEHVRTRPGDVTAIMAGPPSYQCTSFIRMDSSGVSVSLSSTVS